MSGKARTQAGRRGRLARLVPCPEMFSIAHHDLPRTLRAAALAGVAAARAHEGDFSCAGSDPDESPTSRRLSRLPLHHKHLNLEAPSPPTKRDNRAPPGRDVVAVAAAAAVD